MIQMYYEWIDKLIFYAINASTTGWIVYFKPTYHLYPVFLDIEALATILTIHFY